MTDMLDYLHADKQWGAWSADQLAFNRLNAAGNITVDYWGQIVWTAGADLDSFAAVAFTQPVDGIKSMIPYSKLLPKLVMSTTTGQVPAIVHLNMGTAPVFTDPLTKDQALDMVLNRVWWSSRRSPEFHRIAQRELRSRRIYIGANDTIGKEYNELCGAHSKHRLACHHLSQATDRHPTCADMWK